MKNTKFYNVVYNKSSKSVDVDIYGAIVGGGKESKWEESDFTLDELRDKLEEADGFDTINLNISSPGGSVFVASAMMSILQKYKNKGVTVNAYVMGLAASAASFLIMMADNIYMGKTAMLMVHKPLISSLFFTANATNLRKYADELDDMENGVLINAYMMKATKSLSKDKLKAFIEKETWLTSDECKEYFDIKLIEDDVSIAASLSKEDYDILSKYHNTPQKFKNAKIISNSATNGEKVENALKKKKLQAELDIL